MKQPAYEHVVLPNWAVVVSKPSDEAMKPVYTLAGTIAAIGIALIMVLFILGVAISKELRDDAMYPEILALAEMLGVSSYWTTELYGHDVYNNAFSSAKYAGRDGLALCATNHPIQGTSSTMGNRPAVGADPTVLRPWEARIVEIGPA